MLSIFFKSGIYLRLTNSLQIYLFSFEWMLVNKKRVDLQAIKNKTIEMILCFVYFYQVLFEKAYLILRTVGKIHDIDVKQWWGVLGLDSFLHSIHACLFFKGSPPPALPRLIDQQSLLIENIEGATRWYALKCI